MDNMYWIKSRKGGYEFTKAFYELGLHAKYQVVEPILCTLDALTYDRLVRAFLQHSNPDTKKEYPCQGERKLSTRAKLADEAFKRLKGKEIEQ